MTYPARLRPASRALLPRGAAPLALPPAPRRPRGAAPSALPPAPRRPRGAAPSALPPAPRRPRGAAPFALILAFAYAGCDDAERLDGVDAGGSGADASRDDGGSANDAGSTNDGGATTTDAGPISTDAGSVPPDPTVGQIDVPAVTLGPDGTSPEIGFELPPGVTSFMVIVEGAAPANYIVRRLTAPSGDDLVSDAPVNLTPIEQFVLGEFAPQFKSPNRVVQDVEVSAALFPNNPGVSVGSGAYTLVVTGITPPMGRARGEISVRILHRSGEPAQGVLPITLYFSGAGGIDASAAPGDPLVQDAITELRNIYRQANLRIGPISYRDVDARFRTIALALDGSPGSLEEMFALTAGEGPGLHFFFVDRFEGGFPGAMVAGVSGGLPGPARAVGTVNSGVAVALSSAGQDAATLAHVMAHEGGHWLGLFHTSEVTGSEDQHPETPSGQAGMNYLMYPAVGGGTTISPSQGAILRRHMETIAE